MSGLATALWTSLIGSFVTNARRWDRANALALLSWFDFFELMNG